MIIFDGICHLASDIGEEELHTFAKKLGLKRQWYDTKDPDRPHYDLTTPRMVKKALRMGAVELGRREYFCRVWWRKHSIIYRKMIEKEGLTDGDNR